MKTPAHQQAYSRWAGQAGLGLVAGFLVFSIVGFLQFVATGLNVGILVGLDGRVAGLISPSPSLWATAVMFVVVTIACIVLGRELPQAGALGCLAGLLLLTVAGTLRFPLDYFADPESHGLVENILINGSQSLGVPVLAAIVLAEAVRFPRMLRRSAAA